MDGEGATITPRLVRRLANGSRRAHCDWTLAEHRRLSFGNFGWSIRTKRAISRSAERRRRWSNDVLGLFWSPELIDIGDRRLHSLPTLTLHAAVIEVFGADSVLGGTPLLDTRQTVALEVLDGTALALPIKIAATGEHGYENGEKQEEPYSNESYCGPSDIFRADRSWLA